MPPERSRRKTAATASSPTSRLALPPHSITLKTGRLTGNKPTYSDRPQGVIVDEEMKKVYIFSPVVNGGESFSEIYRLDLKHMKWDDLTNDVYHVQYPEDPFSGAVCEQFPFRYGHGSAFFTCNDCRFLLVFGGEREEQGPACSDLLVLDLESLKWWTVAVAGAPVTPRMYPCAIVAGNQLYVFGGRKLDTQGSYATLATFSVVGYNADTHQWKWLVRDEPYPAHVPALGYACDAAVAYGGKKIMLTPGCTEHSDDWEEINFSAERVVLFSTTHHTFQVQTGTSGNFPQSITLYDLYTLPSAHNPPPVIQTLSRKHSSGLQSQAEVMPNLTSSAIICAWSAPPSDPELWLYSLPPDEECRCLNLRGRIADLGLSMNIFVVVGSRMFLLGLNDALGSSDKYNTYIEIKW